MKPTCSSEPNSIRKTYQALEAKTWASRGYKQREWDWEKRWRVCPRCSVFKPKRKGWGAAWRNKSKPGEVVELLAFKYSRFNN